MEMGGSGHMETGTPPELGAFYRQNKANKKAAPERRLDSWIGRAD